MDHDLVPLSLDLYTAARTVAYLATLLLIGSAAFATLLPRWRAAEDDDRSLAAGVLAGTWRLAAWAAGLLLLAHLVRGYAQVRSFLEPFEPFTWAAARPVLLQTAWGAAWLAQLAAALVALPPALLCRRRPAAGLALLGGAALLVVATTPRTGHAVENPWGGGLGQGIHALHLVGGGLWLGSLGVMFLTGLRLAQARGWRPGELGAVHQAVARMVRAFSPLALTGAALAIGTGSLLGVAYVGSLGSLWSTSYGRVLLLKLLLVLVTLGLGAWNWRRLSPGLGTPGASAGLSRSAALELIVALLLLSVTAVLVALPAPNLGE